MTNFWKSSIKDKAKNGMFVGGAVGFLIWQGTNIYTFLLENIPSTWYYLGEWSLPVYLILAGMLTGYIIDKY